MELLKLLLNFYIIYNNILIVKLNLEFSEIETPQLKINLRIHVNLNS